MKVFAFLGFLGTALMMLPMTASAYGRPYCMETSEGWGGSRRDCSYETFEQCYANKVAFNSTCSPNPTWQGRQKRKKYRD